MPKKNSTKKTGKGKSVDTAANKGFDPMLNPEAEARNKLRALTESITLGDAEANAEKQMALQSEGRPYHCPLRDQQIDHKVCQKVQSTQGCKMGAFTKSNLEGCPFWEAKLNSKADGKKPTSKKTGRVGVVSYQTIMRSYFLDKGFAKIEELVDLINNHPSRSSVKRLADAKNTSVGISILKNPKRVKNPMNISYSKKTKIYYCYDVDGMREKEAEDIKAYNLSAKKEKKTQAKDTK